MTRHALPILLALAAAPLRAEDDKVLPCRPTVACTAAISAPGQLEIEAGFQHKRGSASRAESVPLLVKLSLTDWFQLQVGTPGPTLVSGAGTQTFFDASQVLGKVAFALNEGKTVVGATAAVNLPTTTLPDRRTDALFAALVSQDAFGFHADFNVGLNVLGVNAEPQRQTWGALSVSRDFPAGFTGMVEGWGYSAAGALAGRDGGFLFALGYSPVSSICLDVGGDVAVFSDDRRFSVFFGVTAAVAHLWKPR